MLFFNIFGVFFFILFEFYHVQCECRCGEKYVSPTSSTKKSVFETGVNENPWQALILLDGYPRPVCSGTLMSIRTVLTTPKCINGGTFLHPPRVNYSDHTVRVGEHDFSDSNELVIQDFRITDAMFPDNYIPTDHFSNICDYNDAIVLLKLDKDVQYSDMVMPICLPFHLNSESIATGDHVEVTDFGLSYDTDKGVAIVAGKTNATYISSQDCEILTKRNDSGYGESCDDGRQFQFICATTPEGTCLRHYGSPLVLQKPENNLVYQYGVFATGFQCNYPGFYVPVKNHLPWIVENTKGENLCQN